MEKRKRKLKVFLAELVTDPEEKELIDQRMDELQQLVATLGGMTVVKIVQQRAKPDYQMYLGKGKLQEIREEMRRVGADLLIIGNILKPSQIYEVNQYMKKYGLQARDRIDLILKIFDLHAKSSEAKLQIELAAIKHMGPRIFGMGMELSRQGGGSGGGTVRGIGETNTEIMRRHLDRRKEQIEKKLKKYSQVRATHRQGRTKRGLPTVGIVGYTNAGKSSLMNVLTNKGVHVEDTLFATLGTNVGELYYPSMKGKGTKVLINDTIGFMRDLPPDLIEAFRSTLEDSITADLLIHLIDAGDPVVHDKIQVVDKILSEIGATQRRLYVFNKYDTITPATHIALHERYSEYDPLFISAHTEFGLDELKKKIYKELVGDTEELHLEYV